MLGKHPVTIAPVSHLNKLLAQFNKETLPLGVFHKNSDYTLS